MQLLLLFFYSLDKVYIVIIIECLFLSKMDEFDS